MSVAESRPHVISNTVTNENAAPFLIRVCSVCYTPVNSILIPWPQDLGDVHHLSPDLGFCLLACFLVLRTEGRISHVLDKVLYY